MLAPVAARGAVVVGGGHNGLVAACYLAKAGRDVVVLEATDRPGGGSRTEETVPGYRFDLHSVAHNIINMTVIPRQLDLAGAGLVYQEMNPFSVAMFADGRRVRFHRSIEATVDSIAEHSGDEARAYTRVHGQGHPRDPHDAAGGAGRDAAARRAHARWRRWSGPCGRARRPPSPTPSARTTRCSAAACPSNLTRAPVSAFAAHAGVGPSMPGGAVYAWWQAAYHLFGQWHARGGAQGLTDALVRRARVAGRRAALQRAPSPASTRPTAGCGRSSPRPRSGSRPAAVITAMDPKTALLQLLHPPLAGQDRADLTAARRGNVVQALVHVATDRLPPYPNARPGDWNGLQSFVDRLDDLVTGWAASEARQLPDPLPLYAFTTSAIDDTLAPARHHTVYLACPAAPSRVRGRVAGPAGGVRRTVPGDRRGPGARLPGQHRRRRHPHPRRDGARRALARAPTRCTSTCPSTSSARSAPPAGSGRHRTPVQGLYLSGAGTGPTGGIAGTPGRAAAQALLADTAP